MVLKPDIYPDPLGVFEDLGMGLGIPVRSTFCLTVTPITELVDPLGPPNDD